MTKVEMLYDLRNRYSDFWLVNTTIEQYAKTHTKAEIVHFCQLYTSLREKEDIE